MKKIVLGCAAVLLSLGLLAGCNDNPSTVDAVIINVDSNASVVVGETLELPYTVEPEKATVVAASDHEEYVTADAQDGILYLRGVTEGSAIVTLVGTYKKYAEANVNINVSVVTEATEKTEPGTQQPGTTYPAPTGDEDPAYFGFEVDGVGYYMTGETVSGYDYEGALTTSVDDAVLVSIEKGTAENEFYLSFGEESDVKYITIIETTSGSSTYTNLSYAEEKAPIYWNETYGCWGNEEATHFLCYNSRFGCLYCSDIESYIGSSPIATLIEPAEVSKLTILGSTEVYVNNSIRLTVVANLGASNSVVWTVESKDETGAATVEDGVVTGVTAGVVTVTATSTENEAVSASIDITVNAIPDELPFTVGEEYWLTYQYSGSTYYFDGTISSQYYGSVKTSSASGAFITIEESDGGYTLGFTDSDDTQQYIYLYGSGNYQDFGIRETAYEFTYDYSLETFVGETDDNTLCYIGNYYKEGTSYAELRAMKVDDYGSEEGTTYCIAEFVAPEVTTAITINGVDQLRTGGTTTLTATVEEGEDYRVTWSITSGGDYATIDSNTGVLTAGETADQVIVVTATSLKYTEVTATHTVTLFEASTGNTEYTISITPESLAEEFNTTVDDHTNITNNSSSNSSYDDGAILVTWTGNGTTNQGICPWNGVEASKQKTDIRIYSGSSITVESGAGTLEKVVIDAEGNDSKYLCGTSFSANGGTVDAAVSTGSDSDQVTITATGTSMTITRSGSVCYATGIVIYYLA